MKIVCVVNVQGLWEEKKSRKVHTCDHCGKEIENRKLYHVFSHKAYEKYKRYKLHRSCSKFFVGELAMKVKPKANWKPRTREEKVYAENLTETRRRRAMRGSMRPPRQDTQVLV